MTTATAAQPVPQASAQTAEKPEVPIRHMKFDFNAQDADPNFYLNAELASAYFEALSIFLTYGEDLVIDTARYHRDFLTDPVLKQRVTSLIGQEALHSKVHEEWNEILKEHRFPVPLYRFLAENVFNYGFKRFPHRLQLSLMAGIEHFTAVLAEFMMKHEDHFFHSEDEKQRGLWMWHMLEEAEHKDIAYDVYQELSGSYPLRISGFALALFTIWFLVPLGGVAIPFLRKPRNLVSLSFWKDAKRSLGLLIGRKNGVYGSTLGHVFDYLRPDFHPNDHDTSEYLEYYKERLLHPETGLLTPYFVKQVVPPVRA
ncbi:metal-dependent hydrolase [Marinobacter xestospongiae]|uniref:Metal-dependent hydrolase n=1 Tax=Marinobacter xestospongiae TaxID=994319 RepID=A0ABU3W3N1_9GAMM|nr:metal-dependent hydrolase [Marinobacter xestospongiae]MDV2081154.1 metal-dependent hydrolase [Marinobacter xestospongiae]